MRIIVADDHPLYREAVARQITRLFTGSTVAEAATLDEAVALARDADTKTNLFVLDFCMPGMSAQELSRLAADFADVPILILSGWASAANIQAMVQAGARGYLPKTATREQFAHAIQLLLAGGTSISTEIMSADEEPATRAAAPWVALLTAREMEVLRAVTRGLANKEIARELNLAEVTIKLHISAIFRKTGTRSRTEAAMLASRAGLA